MYNSSLYHKIIKIKKQIYKRINFAIKQLLPQSFLSRSILIIGLTLLTLQIILGIIFYDSHWRKTKNLLFQNLARDIAYITHLVNDAASIAEIDEIINTNSNYLEIYPQIVLNDTKLSDKAPLNANLKELKNKINRFIPNQVYLDEYNPNYSIVKLIIHIKDNVHLSFYLEKELFFVISINYLITFIIASYFIMLLIIMQFFRLQLRPLKQLIKASKKFGKGEKVPYIPASGSLEIRQAITTFNEMREQVENFIEQRTLLLSSVSHDLKTSLTKINLILDLNPSETSKDLKEETENMKDIINSYLNFTKGDYYQNDKTSINIKYFFNKIKNSYAKDIPISLVYDQSPRTIQANMQSFSRAIINIIENAKKYGNIINIIISDLGNHNISIVIEDNGVGISENDYENVLKPFYKINAARTADKSSVGLGLYIVKDIITKHGGDLSLGKSSLGGLRVEIKIPF